MLESQTEHAPLSAPDTEHDKHKHADSSTTADAESAQGSDSLEVLVSVKSSDDLDPATKRLQVLQSFFFLLFLFLFSFLFFLFSYSFSFLFFFFSHFLFFFFFFFFIFRRRGDAAGPLRSWRASRLVSSPPRLNISLSLKL